MRKKNDDQPSKREGKLLWAWVDRSIQGIVRQLASTKGISISEYVRQLVIEDLDSRSIFTTQLKKKLQATSCDSIDSG